MNSLVNFAKSAPTQLQELGLSKMVTLKRVASIASRLMAKSTSHNVSGLC